MNKLEIHLETQISNYAEWLLKHLSTSEANKNKSSIIELLKDQLKTPKDVRTLASDFGHIFGFGITDWHWVAFQISHDYSSKKRLFSLIPSIKRDLNDILIFKKLTENACDRSREIYLTNPIDLKSQPKVFTLAELLKNGCNFNKNLQDFLPVLGVSNFGLKYIDNETYLIYDDFQLDYKQNIDDVWNPNTLAFELSAEKKQRIKAISKFTKAKKIENIDPISGDKNISFKIKIDGKGLKKHYESQKKESITSKFLKLFKK